MKKRKKSNKRRAPRRLNGPERLDARVLLAADLHWIAGQPQTFIDTPTSWQENALINPGDTAHIGTLGSLTLDDGAGGGGVTLDKFDVESNAPVRLDIASQTMQVNTLNVTTGRLDVHDDLPAVGGEIIGQTGSSSDINISQGGDLRIGDDSGILGGNVQIADGNITLGGTATLDTDSMDVGNNGTGTFNLLSGFLTSSSGDTTVGDDYGTGTLTTSGGGTFNINALRVGVYNGTGTINIGDTKSVVVNSTVIGDSGTGTLNIPSDDTLTSTGGGIVGNASGSVGTATVQGTWQQGATAELDIGNQGKGSVKVDGGSIVSGGVGVLNGNSSLTISSGTVQAVNTANSGGIGTAGTITMQGGSLIAGVDKDNNQKGPITVFEGGTLNEATTGAYVWGSTIDVAAGGLIAGVGKNEANVLDNGKVAPGPTGSGVLVVDGTYTEPQGGELDITLGAQAGVGAISPSDSLQVKSNATLHGNLIVTAANGVDPTQYTAGVKFDILTTSARIGKFANMQDGPQTNNNDLPKLGANLQWNVDYEPGYVRLQVVGPATCAVPASNEGSLATMTGTLAAPALQDTTATVNWGDGTPADSVPIAAGATQVTDQHTYLDDHPVGTTQGSFTASFSYSDTNGDSTFGATTQAYVNNVPPVLSNLLVSPSNEGIQATLTGTITSPSSHRSFSVDVAWGDGTADSSVNVPAGATSFTANHTYADENTGGYAVVATATDDEGGVSTGSTTANVNNVAPTWTVLAVTTSREGAPSTLPAVLSGTLADPGTLDSHAVSVDWGDGTPLTTFNLAAGVLSFRNVTHSFPANNAPGNAPALIGTYPVNVTVTDDDGAGSTSLVTAHVRNVSPAFSNLVVTPISEGGTATLSGTIHDPSALESFFLKLDWGDGNDPNSTGSYEYLTLPPLPAGQTVFSVTASHPYADEFALAA